MAVSRFGGSMLSIVFLCTFFSACMAVGRKECSAKRNAPARYRSVAKRARKEEKVFVLGPAQQEEQEKESVLSVFCRRTQEPLLILDYVTTKETDNGSDDSDYAHSNNVLLKPDPESVPRVHVCGFTILAFMQQLETERQHELRLK